MRILLMAMFLVLAASGSLAVEDQITNTSAEMEQAIARNVQAARCGDLTDLALMAKDCASGYDLCTSSDGSEWCCPYHQNCGPEPGDCVDQERSPN